MFRSDNCRFHRLLVAMPSRASKLTYQALLTPQRLRASSIRGRTLELEVLSDTGRIVASSAFRRLQTKAQVFSLERNAAVRTRLTHSLEVSMYGQFIAERTFELLLARGRIPRDLRLAFVQTVQNACLLHDIGNPPFGHLGEFAIRDWFAKNGDELAAHWVASGMKTKAATAYMAGFLNFDGNPQGLRIVTRLMWLNDQWGLNLTCTLLGSTLKYLGTAPDPDRPFRKKAGFFEAERGRVRSAWSTLGLRTDRKGDPVQRHPLVFLMEAADDIAYCLSDIEDALEKKVCTQAEFFGEIDAIRTSLSADARRAARKAQATIRSGVRNEASNAAFIEFSRAVTRQLTELAAKSFERNENEILDGSYANALLDDDPAARAILGALKGFARRRIFVAREALEIELSGFRIVQTILDSYKALLRLTPDEFRRLEPNAMPPLKYGELALESRLRNMLPNKHLLAYEAEREAQSTIEPALRTHLIVDYLTGMTDGFALKVFRMLTGTAQRAQDG